eukprot:TRINITY_DN1670_c0_g1_i13.p1 TRINITY_DN1670_c0_g1~~TRINITY_DN1670_c0_g1_i13.p1  ORF type:complete len:330 (+),score=97.14 TRINITY_DN1670_c0_g1_i13:88-1077(+)
MILHKVFVNSHKQRVDFIEKELSEYRKDEEKMKELKQRVKHYKRVGVHKHSQHRNLVEENKNSVSDWQPFVKEQQQKQRFETHNERLMKAKENAAKVAWEKRETIVERIREKEIRHFGRSSVQKPQRPQTARPDLGREKKHYSSSGKSKKKAKTRGVARDRFDDLVEKNGRMEYRPPKRPKQRPHTARGGRRRVKQMQSDVVIAEHDSATGFAASQRLWEKETTSTAVKRLGRLSHQGLKMTVPRSDNSEHPIFVKKQTIETTEEAGEENEQQDEKKKKKKSQKVQVPGLEFRYDRRDEKAIDHLLEMSEIGEFVGEGKEEEFGGWERE